MNETAIFLDNFLTDTYKIWGDHFLSLDYCFERHSQKSVLRQRRCLEEQREQLGERDILLERDRLANSDHKNDSSIVRCFPEPLDLRLSV